MLLLQGSGSNDSLLLLLLPRTDLRQWKTLRFEQCLVLSKERLKAKQIHADFQNTLGDSALSNSTVAKRTSEFKFGRESLDVIRVVDGQKVLLPQNS